jgi:ribosome-associated toxin RatA of RatAB toxin-antitoxin module
LTNFGGSSSAEIAVSPRVCFDWVCDTPRTPEWHRAITAVEVLERDDAGRTSLVTARIDAIVARVEVDLRLSYEENRAVWMRRESGDLSDLWASWTFEDLGEARTRATFETEFDPGRVLSMFARGPLLARLEDHLAGQPPDGLRSALQASSRRAVKGFVSPGQDQR